MNIIKKKAYGTGRRKTACARVFIQNGIGKVLINKKPFEKYFNKILFKKFFEYINDIVNIKNFNLYITVKGGGFSGQIGAIKHGIARALLQYNISYKTELKKKKLLTRDSRQVERKKVGLKKSRKAPQFSKR